MRLSRKILATAGAAFVLASAYALPASASDATAQAPALGEQVISGGTTQSVDPTQYNYVAPVINSGRMAPMSATGAAYVSAFPYSWGGVTIPVPSGYIVHTIDGSGLHINSEQAWYAPSPALGGLWGVNICNWRIDYQNRRSSDASISTTWVGSTNGGCATSIPTRLLYSINVVQGLQCARLYVNGTYRGEQCHSVS